MRVSYGHCEGYNALGLSIDLVPLQGFWRMTGVTVASAPDVRTTEAERR